ncbi:Polynucleotidyl transferase, ribonuclease H superfamily protein [Trifolium repens]|jgi:ribonuclease HI|nr:Polynucleotidyl transferase, ribonuclease H superfamily protein [Trifolium repens]
MTTFQTIYNNLSHWLGGFAKQIGYTNAYRAELWGAYEDLRWACTKGYVNVELRIDSLVVVRCLNGGEVRSVDGRKLIRRIKDLLLEDWNVPIIHVYRVKLIKLRLSCIRLCFNRN